MGLSISKAKELRDAALLLPRHEHVRGRTIGYIAQHCNGVGADWMEKAKLDGISLLTLSNLVYGWANAASIDHDLGYLDGGTWEDRKRVDDAFLENCRYIAKKTCGWWNPKRYHRLNQACSMYRLLRMFGWAAFNHRTTEDKLDDEYVSEPEELTSKDA